MNFGPQTKKVIGANVDPPKLNLSTDSISARRVCWPLKFLHALKIDQGLLAHPRAASRWALPHISSFLFSDCALSYLVLCAIWPIWLQREYIRIHVS